MNLHPALLAVIVVDVLAGLALILAMVGAVRVVLGWNGESASRSQLLLERRAEESSALARLGLGLLMLASVFLVVVINHVLPAIVPGAMCGVGALQAMPGGTSTLALRGVALAVLWIWAVLDTLNRRTPQSTLVTVSARALLVAGPVALVAGWQTGQALLHVDVQQPVSCCAAVYDLAAVGVDSSDGPAIAGTQHAVVGLAMGVAIVAAAYLIRLQTRRGIERPALIVAWAMVVIAWTGLAGWTLVDVSGPYLYGVLGHRCPLCFFLPHHGAVGYALYGALAGVLAEALTAATSALAGRRFEAVREHTSKAVGRATVGVMLGLLVFTLLASGPAIVWRMRFGVWIDG